MKRIVSTLLTTAMFISLTVTGFANHNEISNANFIAKADSACCDSIDSIIIQPYDSLIVSCDSAAVTLSVPYDSCYNYVWYGNGSPIFQIGLENILTTTISGTYYVVVSNNCYSATSNVVTVVINTPIYYTSSITNVSCYGLCNGTVTVTPHGGAAPYSIIWSGGSTSFSRTSLCAGTYNFVITDSLGCIDSGSVVITQPAALAVAGSCSCGATTCLLTAQPSGGTAPYTYQWTTGHSTQSITVPSTFITITVTVTDAHGCTRSRIYRRSTCTIIKNDVVQESTEANSTVLYPNPFDDYITVEFLQEPVEKIRFAILDVTGRVVSEYTETDYHRNVYYINVEEMPSGIYFLRAESGSEYWVNRIIKE